MIILDTNVVAVLMGTSKHDVATAWLNRQDPHALFLTAITRAEVRYGIARLPAGSRRDRLSRMADNLFTSQADRTLMFDIAAADYYGDIVAGRERDGRPIGSADAQIAAIARVHDAIVATRDSNGFLRTGVTTVDPFES
ncbi:type II toxin-antitoxin system VapC family toxin [Gordonia sp. (in: high G+C Gram-positive bacteria)]|jgi:predicted nucleic acid-binding protein|uniref:type II toxin-antitoxin system VapC family toxin n=1 Tax=Gordonia sp. (in: high G+C Gram-positive bacteria) TaxID=84139 RepID=UPI001D1AE0BC|nr:type II toxin-antitoxin system VapC family toxin [Gordonia sp. (in: high G+C Gram-positive bacteria)]MCB1294550.1 type II toxin-antitoxin system VapC family toxin [Gordonia sp. (in: high G+C Gram-positive bacteria)]HMS75434.1 type II toxin-antitoxin system VapC family toxin [Gordonia sp. (in: high G+C Gram-positive bacteria)]HQV19732.1 type II toxin-antitoxin system VapC family toxin [Gordonia sp. (in: high G+C Gram-positive bacteria)]